MARVTQPEAPEPKPKPQKPRAPNPVLLIPAAPVHTISPTDIAEYTGIHAVLTGGLAGLVDLRLDRRGVALHGIEPALTVVGGRGGQMDAVGLESREPGAIAGTRRRGDTG